MINNNTFSGPKSARTIVALLAAVMVLGISSRAIAQTPALEVYYDRFDPKTPFSYKWKGEEKNCNIGAFHWVIPPSEFGTGGLDRNFTGYCAEVNVPIVSGKLYRFRQLSLLEPRNYGLEATPEGIRVAERRATLIRELFGRYYTENKTANPDNTYAMQLALWELTEEAEPMDREVSLNAFAGTFQVTYPKDQAPAYVTLAQTYLDSLTGDDSIYYENPEIKGRELVRLQGIENEEGIVAQSQYALRYINGGAPGVSPFARNLGNTGGGGFGALGGGIGSGLGTGESNGEGGPLLSTGTPLTTTSNTPTTGGPPTSTITRPPAGGPITSVPAPAGLLLGLVAVGAMATRKIYFRLAQR
ncbi:MAG TPA: hypothetical protein VG097_09050 [Gemmata sp.]|jgi:hypothetical protein|nr:hypothetical protein [Gemmata sp.]